MRHDADARALEVGLDAILNLGVETDDHGFSRFGQLDIALRDRTDGAADDVEADLGGFDFAEATFEGFERAVDVSLEQDAENLLLVLSEGGHEAFEVRHARAGTSVRCLLLCFSCLAASERGLFG